MERLSTLTQTMSDHLTASASLAAMRGMYDRLSCQMQTSAGLVITATSGNKVPKTGAAICYGTVKGQPFSIAAGTDLCAVPAGVTNAKFNVCCFFANKADESLTATDMTALMGVEAAVLEGVVFPKFPEGKTLIGYIIINPAGTGAYVANTTALNDGTVFSSGGTFYISTVGPFDPSAII